MFQIIKGTFHVRGFQPDGDSIRFKPERPSAWEALTWPSSKPKSRRSNPAIQLRLEGIDALEIHYEGFHQPRSFAIGALEVLLSELDIRNVQYTIPVTTILDADDGKPGFIAVQEVDAFSRPVSLVFPASAALRDGDKVHINDLPADQCINFRLCHAGLVYPTFYNTTDPAVMHILSVYTKEARAAKRGIWVIDRTTGFTLWEMHTLFNDVTLLPKLFRRLISFCLTNQDLAQLPAYLKAKGDLVQLRDGTNTTLDTLMRVEGKYIALTAAPEELVFFPK